MFPGSLSDDGSTIGHGLGAAAFAERMVLDRSQIVVIGDEIASQSGCSLACGVILGPKMGTSIVANDIAELVEKYRSGDLLLDELVTATHTIEQINEAIESAKSSQAVRNRVLFDDSDDGEAG